MSAIALALVAARARNGVIGRDNDLPWRIRSDLKRFKEITLGKPVIMGRKTWDSLPRKPLPGRVNIVVSRTAKALDGAIICPSLETAIDVARDEARSAGVNEVCLIGGAQLYEAALDFADKLYLTDVALEPEGDAYFPDIVAGHWREIAREDHRAAEGDDADFVLRTLVRQR